jgi:hypothetical protein
MFDAGEVIVEDFLGSRTGDDRGFAIGRRHGNLCGHTGAGQIGSVFGARHRSVSYCVQVSIFLQHSAQYASARGTRSLTRTNLVRSRNSPALANVEFVFMENTIGSRFSLKQAT